MKISRNPSYFVGFGYASDGGRTIGKAPTRRMTHEGLEFALAMVDPFNHEKWMKDVHRLHRKGDRAVITTMSQSDNHGIVHRAIIVERT